MPDQIDGFVDVATFSLSWLELAALYAALQTMRIQKPAPSDVDEYLETLAEKLRGMISI